MEEFKQVLKIPIARVAVIIGKKGETKKQIEKESNTKIKITKEGEVTITAEDSFDAWITKSIIKAIGRGFSPEIALLLLDDAYSFEIVEMKDWAKTDKAMARLRGRVIGEHGKSREKIEDLTDSYISVFGKTVGIIAKVEKMPFVRKAVEMLLGGSRHTTVFRMLEEEKRKWEKQELMGR